MSKGSTPRPVNKEKYDANYERIYGKDCTACKKRGYHLDWDKMTMRMLKTTCLLCNGTGRCKI